MTDRDRTTRTRARTPGVVAQATSWRCAIGSCDPAQYGSCDGTTKCTKGGCKPVVAMCMSGADLSGATAGKAPSERPALQPYRGKPAARNVRGDRGNVGIIRSPVRASILPDHLLTSYASKQRGKAIPRHSPFARLHEALATLRRCRSDWVSITENLRVFLSIQSKQ